MTKQPAKPQDVIMRSFLVTEFQLIVFCIATVLPRLMLMNQLTSDCNHWTREQMQFWVELHCLALFKLDLIRSEDVHSHLSLRLQLCCYNHWSVGLNSYWLHREVRQLQTRAGLFPSTVPYLVVGSNVPKEIFSCMFTVSGHLTQTFLFSCWLIN